MKFNLILLLVGCASAIKVEASGKSYIHLHLVEDPAPAADDGAKVEGKKDLDANVEPSFKYGTALRGIPEPHGTKELKIYNGKPDPVPLEASWPGANGEDAPKGGAAAPATPATSAAPAAPAAPAALI